MTFPRSGSRDAQTSSSLRTTLSLTSHSGFGRPEKTSAPPTHRFLLADFDVTMHYDHEGTKA